MAGEARLRSASTASAPPPTSWPRSRAWQGRRVYAFTRPGDAAAQNFARSLGAVWAGGSDETPPEPLDAAIIFAPVGELVPAALRAVQQGRPRGLRRHPHERHPELPLSHPVGGAPARLGRQSDPRGRARILGVAPQAGIKMQVTPLSAQPRPTRRWPTCAPAASTPIRSRPRDPQPHRVPGRLRHLGRTVPGAGRRCLAEHAQQQPDGARAAPADDCCRMMS